MTVERWNKTKDMMQLLTYKVRVLSVEQVAREYCQRVANPVQAAKKMILSLTKEQLLETQTVMVHPLIALDEPVFRWTPGDPPPNLPRLAWQLRSRWKLPPKAMIVCRASKQARKITGGTVGGRRMRATELRHDLHVSELYFKLERDSPHLSWVHEDTLVAAGLHNQSVAIPDALVNGEVHDFGGSYKSEKLAILHHSFSTGPYTIW